MAPSLARGAAPHGTQPRATTSASAWRRWVRRLCLATATFALASVAQAEGTRTLHPSGATGNRGVMDVTADSTFAGVAVSRQFLYVYAQAGEVILLGSRNRDNGGNIYVFNPRDFGPRGNEPLLAASDANFTCSTQSGRGSITSRAQELAGPNSADGTATVAGGFNPCWYTAPTTGIYGVRFTGATSGGASSTAAIATPQILESSRVSAWDVTVRSSQSSLVDLNGRVFTYAWTVYLQSNGRVLNNDLYYVSQDGYRYRQTFRGLDPNRAAFYANAAGFIDTNGSPLYRDLRGNSAAVSAGPSFAAGVTAQRPQYPIFFSDVSPGGPNAAEIDRVLTALAIPLAPAAPILTSPDFVGNLGGHNSTVSAGGTFRFTTENTLTYEIVISRDGSNFDPANPQNRVLTGVALTGNHTVLWNGLDNSGSPFPAGTYGFKIVGRNGEIHFPMMDVEANSSGGPTLTKLNGPSVSAPSARTVYYDDRGYRTANGTPIGALNGHLCGAGSLIGQPVPTHSLVGLDSGTNYRAWGGSADSNSDCNNRASEYFGTAKGLDLWALEKSQEFNLPIVIEDLPNQVDVGTAVSVTSSVLAGESAYGQFSFNNAGAVTATGVTYSATLGNPAVPATCPASVNFTVVPAGVGASYSACVITLTGMPTSLTGGQSLNFSFNYVVQATNPGPIPIRTTIAAANETAGMPAPNQADAQTTVATPEVSVAKSASPGAGAQLAVGDTVTYSVAVTVANAPLTASFAFSDTLGAGLGFGAVTNAHASFSCTDSLSCSLPAGTAMGTYTVSYTAVVQASAGNSVANGVRITVNGGDGDPVCGTCSLTHQVEHPAIELIKASALDLGADGVLNAGDTINYSFTVRNTGNVPLTSVGVAEVAASFTGTGTPPVVSGGPIGLAVGASDSTTFTASYLLTQADIDAGGVSNQARATGSSPRGNDVTDLSDSNDPALTGPDDPTSTPLPSIALVKAGTLDLGADGVLNAGDTINYRFTVTNTGPVPLANVRVAEVAASFTGTGTPPVVSGGPISLAVGASDSTTFTASYQITQEDINAGGVSNQARATGSSPQGVDVADLSDSDDPAQAGPDDPTTTPLAQAPSITLVKASALDLGANGTLNAGDTITYSFTVTNTGNVPLANVRVAEVSFTGTGAPPVVSGGPIALLAVGASDSTTFTASYQITQADIDARGVTNQARATGSSPSGTDDVTDLSDSNDPAVAGPDDPTVTPLVPGAAAPAPIPVDAPWSLALLTLAILVGAGRVRKAARR